MRHSQKKRLHLTSTTNRQYTVQVSLTPNSLESRTVRCDAVTRQLCWNRSLFGFKPRHCEEIF